MQERLLLLVRVVFLLDLVFTVLLLILGSVVREEAYRHMGHNRLASLGLVLIAGGTWFALSRYRIGPRGLVLAEFLPLLAVSVLLAATGVSGWHLEPQRYGIIVGGAMIAMARVFMVPSTWQRTLVTSLVLVGGPIAAAGYRAVVPMPGVVASSAGPLVAGAIWGTITLILTAIGSKVIFGLRREIREARSLGQYTLGAKLGEGGMGQVFLAKHHMLRRPTAIKMLPQGKAGVQAIHRFEREVQITATLKHPNTVSIFDYGRSVDGVFYYAMEFLDGVNLATLVQDFGPQPRGRVMHILRQACSALAEAHRSGLIHRDIKPANIILTDQGGEPDFVKVVDFGLVKDLAADTQLTQAGGLAGTPAYLAPECITDPEHVDPRSDLYALGATAYFLITGSDVFSGRTVVEVLSYHMHREPEAPGERLGEPVEPQFEALILKCLAKRPDERPQSALELRELLDACPADPAWSEERAARWWNEWRARSQVPAPPQFDSDASKLTIGLRALARTEPRS